MVHFACMPSPLPRQVRWSLFARLSPSPTAFPVKKSGRLLQLLFRGLLSVHFTLRPACSRSRLATLSIESSDSFVASTAAPIATGWSEPVPGVGIEPRRAHFVMKDKVTFPRAPLQSRKVGFPDSGFGRGFPREVFPRQAKLKCSLTSTPTHAGLPQQLVLKILAPPTGVVDHT